jgi:hypothetical protein
LDRHGSFSNFREWDQLTDALRPQIGIGIIWNYHGNQQLTNGMNDARRKAQKANNMAKEKSGQSWAGE